MNRVSYHLKALLTCIALLGTLSAQAQPPNGEAVSIVITAAGLHNSTPPILTPADVVVLQQQERLPVVQVSPFQKDRAGLDLAILFDDSLESNFAPQLAEIAAFIRSLPPATRVAVAYIRNPTFTMGQEFTTDRELAVKALQVPLGSPRQFDSPYLALTDLVTAMPENAGRRAVLMISDGVDRFRGPLEPLSPDLEPAYQKAQRRGVLVYAIYATGVGRNSLRVSNAQGALTQLARETGGEAFIDDVSTAASLRPHLQELQQLLGQQYLISFLPKPNAVGRYEHIRFRTNLRDVELIAPDHIYVPGT